MKKVSQRTTGRKIDRKNVFKKYKIILEKVERKLLGCGTQNPFSKVGRTISWGDCRDIC